MLTIEDYKKTIAAFESAGIPFLSRETSAKILAVTCVLGNNEFMVLNQKYKADVEYIQRRFCIDAGMTPTPEIIAPLKHYVHELENAKELPEWAERLFQDRYQMKIYL